ncbi:MULTISPECIES: hypothetical protein [Bradyrhizobium]|uniref:Uncharacterized protein n=1 Tax=Bradyrhizobium elkanii TaxID=29448 RepID=A0A8I2C2E3_BRAEL|nr:MULTISPECIES: hypothetical protein [Bradyrhizobium]MBP1290707.1 hypothetical protein [Bradyrhizobium elkanii]MCP1928977.1 hypothetical protein [Bradyrhizobium elkanii]MCS3473701.1 hypothetical protein [Bradyrhizobium elkanii]MCS3580408.1 hypothetical protein [Bradyrhizobium elkanii]MCS3723284.1 hypothetical protein [Bradyrhizobium elkanii]
MASQHASLRVTVPLPRSLATAIGRGMIPGARRLHHALVANTVHFRLVQGSSATIRDK